VEESRVMVACGAGAGLAAVYNAPLGGALFVLEGLLGTVSLPVVLPALTTSAIAVVFAWWGLGSHALYSVPHFPVSASLIVWSIVMGPFFGIGAFWFTELANTSRAHATRNWQLPMLSLINFTAIGLLAIEYPQLLGLSRRVFTCTQRCARAGTHRVACRRARTRRDDTQPNEAPASVRRRRFARRRHA
jgi:H+/Cl- antiporter ClcA